MKSKRMKVILAAVLVLVFIGCGVWFVLTQKQYERDELEYTEAQEEFLLFDVNDFVKTASPSAGPTPSADPTPSDESTQPDITDGNVPETETPPVDTTAPATQAPPELTLSADMTVDFDKLKAVNEDIVGWIWIPDTVVNYPLLQGSSNSEYLNLNYRRQYSSIGSIFIEVGSMADFSFRNTIIYGHNVRNRSMFGALNQYADLAYAEAHKTVYIFLEDGIHKYEVFSAYQTIASSDTYTNTFSSTDAYRDYLELITNATVSITPATEVSVKDYIITLSTCTNRNRDDRFIVHAVLVEIIS